MKKRNTHVIRDGLFGVLVCAFFTFIFLFGNNAGWWRATEGPMMGVMMTFGWPFVLGSAVGGLLAWGGGSAPIGILIAIAGLILNVIYAFAMGVLVGFLLRRK